jgi:hypothetical protein
LTINGIGAIYRSSWCGWRPCAARTVAARHVREGRDPGKFMSKNRYNHQIESIAVGAADRALM